MARRPQEDDTVEGVESAPWESLAGSAAGDRPGNVSDEALCRRVAAGDDGAFDALVTRYQGRAYRLAWSFLHDAEDARDASQEAFIRVFERAGSFGGRSRFSTWFYRILVNQCLDHRRRRGGRHRHLVAIDGAPPGAEEHRAVPVDPGPSAADALDREALRARLWQAAATLPAQQRAALVLHVQDELPADEIAAVLGCAPATVRVHLHRAVAGLRRILDAAADGGR